MGGRFDPASLRCTGQVGVELLSSSRTVGWHSLLIDHHRVRPDEAEFLTQPTSDQTIVVILSGENSLESYHAGRWRPATYHAGSVGLTPGHKIDRLRRRPGGGRPGGGRHGGTSEKANLYIPSAVFAEVADHHRAAGQTVAGTDLNALAFADPLLAQTAVSLLRAARHGASDLYAETAAVWLATHLLSSHARRIDAQAAPRAPTITDGRLARVLEMMSARLSEPLSLETLAAEAGISKFHFTRVFRHAVGSTPHATLAGMRFDAACTLLRATDLGIGTIAGRCGYSRPSQMNAAFARRLGESPGAWRARQRT